jgi:hypothetical protein
VSRKELVVLAAAGCAACCAVPLAGLVAGVFGIAAASALGALRVGTVALLFGPLAIVAVVVFWSRSRRSCSPTRPVPVTLSRRGPTQAEIRAGDDGLSPGERS